MIKEHKNRHTHYETNEQAEIIEFQLRQKRDKLTRKLRNIAKGFKVMLPNCAFDKCKYL